MKSVFVQNVARSGRGHRPQAVEPLLVPTWNFSIARSNGRGGGTDGRGHRPSVEDPLPVPTMNFGSGRRRWNGQDVGTDGRNDDGRTPGDPPRPRVVASVSAAGSGELSNDGNSYIDSESDDGTTPGDPHAILYPPTNKGSGRYSRPPQAPNIYGNKQPQKVECPDCGYQFLPTEEKPLLMPVMNFAKRRGSSDPDVLYADSGDDGNAGIERVTDRVTPINCPRCQASFVPENEAVSVSAH